MFIFLVILHPHDSFMPEWSEDGHQSMFIRIYNTMASLGKELAAPCMKIPYLVCRTLAAGSHTQVSVIIGTLKGKQMI